MCGGISLPRAAQVTFLMPSGSLFVHLLLKAVEKKRKTPRGLESDVVFVSLLLGIAVVGKEKWLWQASW